MRRGGQALQHARLREEQAPRADAEEGALAGGVALLEVGPFADEIERLGIGFQDFVGAAPRDDEDVEVFETGVGGRDVHVGFDGDALA